MTSLLFALVLGTYDPLAVSGTVDHVDETWHDTARKRDLPVRIYLPASTKAVPMVIFSHGLGGSRTNNEFLGEHLAKRGYVALFLQHPGSDESVWRGAPLGDRMNRMNKAASGQNLQLRVGDVKFAIDEALRAPTLRGRIDAKAIGMSGHSFGAMTTQCVTGMSFPGIGTQWTDPRIVAGVAYSPSPGKATTQERAFGGVTQPWLLMTGTKDGSPIGNTKPEDRIKVYPALPAGDKYECVLWEAEHSAFTGGRLRGERGAKNPNHHRAMLALTTAFWDAYLRHDAQALAWLKGPGAKSVLEPKDTWKTK
jgi:predicted dienelactone hydrolase